MHFSITSFLAVSSALFSALGSAQTYSDCNPMLKSCPANPAVAGTYNYTFGPSGSPPFGPYPNSFKYLSGQNLITYNSDGALFSVTKSKDSPTIVCNYYIMWGKFEVTMKAAPGAGIVSSLVLQSEDLDEIDWEWLGGKPEEAQSNYFGKGNTDSYDRGAIHAVSSQAEFHTYGMDWTAEKLDWTIDGKVVRTLTPAMVKGDFYPQTPMAARIGIWAGGDPGNDQGVIEWSGGPTNYKLGPFSMIIKNIFIQDYSSGLSYTYSDMSGSASSIKSKGGQIGIGPQLGPGNIPGNVAAGSNSAAARPTTGSSYNAPSNTGRQVSSTIKSEPTPTGGSGSNADSSESTHNSASQSSSSSSPAGANYIATGGSTGTTQAFTGAAASTAVVTAAGMVVAAVGLIAGWIL